MPEEDLKELIDKYARSTKTSLSHVEKALDRKMIRLLESVVDEEGKS